LLLNVLKQSESPGDRAGAMVDPPRWLGWIDSLLEMEGSRATSDFDQMVKGPGNLVDTSELLKNMNLLLIM
jgi:hypothetical protein